MTQPDGSSAQNTFNISNSSVGNVVGSGSIHHYEAAGKSLASDVSNAPQKTILFLAANPISTHQLRLDEEIREIEAGLQRSRYRDRFILQQRWALRPMDLRRALLECKPQIVHFAGHGIGRTTAAQTVETNRKISFADGTEVFDEGVVLEDTAGQPKLVRTEALSALFELLANSVECVVLNACYSEQQAKAIAQHVPYVIGMNQAIGDRAAIEFSIDFYDALGAGESIDRAYQLGAVAIRMAGISEHLTPIVVKRPASDIEPGI